MVASISHDFQIAETCPFVKADENNKNDVNLPPEY
jgi:hypothetical protein